MSTRVSSKAMVLAAVAGIGLGACSADNPPEIHGSVSVGYSSGYYGGGYYGSPWYYGGGYPPAVVVPPGGGYRPPNGNRPGGVVAAGWSTTAHSRCLRRCRGVAAAAGDADRTSKQRQQFWCGTSQGIATSWVVAQECEVLELESRRHRAAAQGIGAKRTRGLPPVGGHGNHGLGAGTTGPRRRRCCMLKSGEASSSSSGSPSYQCQTSSERTRCQALKLPAASRK